MSDVLHLDITVKKSHVAVLSVVVLVASASAAVNVRDSMNVFGDLDMQGNKVLNATEYRFTGSFVREYDEDNDGKIGIVPDLAKAGQDFAKGELSLQKLQVVAEYYRTDKQISRGVKAAPLSEDGKIIASGAYTGIKGQEGAAQAGNFTFSSDINLQNNNIYNAANLNTGNGGGGTGTALDWENARSVADFSIEDPPPSVPGDSVASVSCGSNEVLVSASCKDRIFVPNGHTLMKSVKCDSRTKVKATKSDPDETVGVSGTCVPLKGGKEESFSNQDSQSTFQVPPGANKVNYVVAGGVGGGLSFEEGLGGDGGYVRGSIPVEGGETLNVYVGEDGEDGEGLGDVSTSASGGVGGCVPFAGGQCGGDGGSGYNGPDAAIYGAGGGGAPSIITDSSGQILVAAGGGGGASDTAGGGGGAGGGSGTEGSDEFINAGSGENAANNVKNLGGDAGELSGSGAGESGDTFVRSSLPAPDSERTSREGAKVGLYVAR